MLNNVKKIIFILVILGSANLRAEEFKKQWTPIPNARLYEYEIYLSAKARAQDLYRQGTTKNPSLESTLDTGVYFWRVRAIDSSGKTSAWSRLEKVVLGQDALKISTPTDGERIEIPTTNTNIFFAWESISGADDYQLSYRTKLKGSKIISRISSVPSIAINDFTPNHYQVRAVARKNGEAIVPGAWQEFSVKIVPLARAQIITPANGELLVAHEPYPIKWKRNVKGERSDVVIRSLSQGRAIIHKKTYNKDTSVNLPALPAGRYQISIRDFPSEDDEEQYAEANITIEVKVDPLGWHKDYIGWNLRILVLGNYGYHGASNQFFDQYMSGTSRYRFMNDLRLQGKIWKDYGMDATFNVAVESRYNVPKTSSGGFDSRGLEDSRLNIRGWKQIFPFGVANPLLVKTGLNRQTVHQPIRFRPEGQSQGVVQVDSFRLYSLDLSSEWRWGGWNRNWDFLFELDTLWPILVKSRKADPTTSPSSMEFSDSSIGTGGNASLVPSIFFKASARRKLSHSLRMYYGVNMFIQHISTKEDANISNTEIVDPTKGTASKVYNVGALLGFQWDL